MELSQVSIGQNYFMTGNRVYYTSIRVQLSRKELVTMLTELKNKNEKQTKFINFNCNRIKAVMLLIIILVVVAGVAALLFGRDKQQVLK